MIAVDNNANSAVEITKGATDAVTATKDKLDKIISDILNVKQLDPARIEELRQEVCAGFLAVM